MSKGFNQIDLVFAVIITVSLLFLSVFYSSHFIQPSLNRARSLEMKYLTRGLGDTVFGDAGIPEEWQWSPDSVKPSLGTRIYRIPVHLHEWNSTENAGVMAHVYLQTEKKAYEYSIVVYDGIDMLETELKDKVDLDSDGFLEEVNVTFNVTVPADGEKLIYIYYSRDNQTVASYQTLSENENTLNLTVMSAEFFTGLAESKLNALALMPFQEAREKFGFDYPFRLKVEKAGADWEYGYNLTERETSVNIKRILLQNSTGQIENVRAITYAWK